MLAHVSPLSPPHLPPHSPLLTHLPKPPLLTYLPKPPLLTHLPKPPLLTHLYNGENYTLSLLKNLYTRVVNFCEILSVALIWKSGDDLRYGIAREDNIEKNPACCTIMLAHSRSPMKNQKKLLYIHTYTHMNTHQEERKEKRVRGGGGSTRDKRT